MVYHYHASLLMVLNNFAQKSGLFYTPEHHILAPSSKSTWTGHAAEGALFISMQLSTNAVSTLWKVWVLIRKKLVSKHAHKHEACQLWGRKEKKFHLDSDNFGFIYAGVNNMGSY